MNETTRPLQCDGASAESKYSISELDPTDVDRYCRRQMFTGWFDTSAKNDININEAVQFLVGKVNNKDIHYSISQSQLFFG